MTPTSPPVGFEVRYKPDRGRWRVLATAPTREAAVARMFALMDAHPGGDWHVAAVPGDAGRHPPAAGRHPEVS